MNDSLPMSVLPPRWRVQLAGFIGPTRRIDLRRQTRAVLGAKEERTGSVLAYAEDRND